MAKRVTTKAQARALARQIIEAADQVKEFNAEVAKLEKKRGIDKVKALIPEGNQAVLRFMQENEMSRLDLEEDGYVNFIQATSERIWIATKAEIPDDAPRGAKSLRGILGKELFLKITKRVVDPGKLQKMVDEGEIKEEDIAPAFFTRKRAPYIRYEKGPA